MHLRYLIILLLAIAFTTIPALAQESKTPLKPFSVGERLDFKIYFGFILGGDATMAVEAIESFDGHDCYKIVSTAKSTSTVDMFYKVRDRIESLRDVKGSFSRRYEKRLSEGKHRDHRIVRYEPEKNLALYWRRPSNTPDTLEVIGKVQDILSAFYHVRTVPLKVGESVWIDVHDIDKRYDLEVVVIKQETITVPAGRFDCFLVEPMLKSSGIFRREGNLKIWLTNDEYKMPVQMESKLYFGSVHARLQEFRRGN